MKLPRPAFRFLTLLLLLLVVGVYGVTSYLVAQRTEVAGTEP